MGSTFNKKQGSVQAPPQSGFGYAGVPQPMPQQQQFMPPQQQFMPPQQQFMPQQPAQYRPQMGPPPQQLNVRPSFPSGPTTPQQSVPSSLSLPTGQNPLISYQNDMLLANLTGWTIADIERLRTEFTIYANPFGVIDREGFRKLYIASLLNMTWDALVRDAEIAFRNFDLNQTGTLDFHEYITACSRMTRELNPSGLS
ncbi:unnamed protein product [Rotaria sordida]|uniref:EF-hand domain-containing protein n=1 Tax=Rotaria sordida TaxID=392033 RepID=A0A818YZG6_9BILA|nr:unnamed protein product [Rotaria sordida]CAF3757821.1 unnamed protein product [Rotaria sordida]